MEPHPVSPELIPSDTEDTGASVRVPTDVSRSDPVPHVLHETYYIHDDMAVFLVEGTLFKIHRHFLVQESDVFQWMFACPPRPDGPEGMADDRPIPLPGVLRREFERLLDFFYKGMYRKAGDRLSLRSNPKSWGASSNIQSTLWQNSGIVEWIDLLSITTRFDFQRVRQCAIEAIESNPLLPPIEKIQLAEKHDIPHWRRPAFEALCQRETPISIDEARMIGLENAMSLAQAREIVRERSLSTSSASEAEVWVSKPVPTGWGVAVPTEGAKKKSAPPVGPYNAQLVADVVREVFFPHRLPPPSSPLLGQV